LVLPPEGRVETHPSPKVRSDPRGRSLHFVQPPSGARVGHFGPKETPSVRSTEGKNPLLRWDTLCKPSGRFAWEGANRREQQGWEGEGATKGGGASTLSEGSPPPLGCTKCPYGVFTPVGRWSDPSPPLLLSSQRSKGASLPAEQGWGRFTPPCCVP
jgi:hypothetical protein